MFVCLTGARCFSDTVDHFTALWNRRKWLESKEVAPLKTIVEVGYELAQHLSSLNQVQKVRDIVEEVLARGRALGEPRFYFWQLRYVHMLDSPDQLPAALHEMQKCLTTMGKDIAQTPIGLLVTAELLYYSVAGEQRGLGDCKEVHIGA